MSDPHLSVITICRNEKNILDTCRSVAEQTFDDFEWIVVDGGSTDGTLDILREYEPHMAVLLSEPDQGRYHAMNKGILRARGRYLLFLNGGDYLFRPDTLERIFRYSPPPIFSSLPMDLDADILYGQVLCKETGMMPWPAWSVGEQELNLQFFHRYSLPHQATFIRRELFLRHGLYDQRLDSAGDYEWFLRVLFLHKAKAQYIPAIVSVYNFEGISSSPPDRQPPGLEEGARAIIHYERVLAGKTGKSFPEVYFPAPAAPKARKLRVAVIDHSFHIRTLSTRFVPELLAPYCDVDIYWDDSWLEGPSLDWEAIRNRRYDHLVFFQQIPDAIRELFDEDSVTIIPMYDHMVIFPEEKLPRNARYYNLCNAFHERCLELGLASTCSRFFLNPASHFSEERDYSGLRGFLWERTFIRPSTVERIVDISRFDSFHIHQAPDPIITPSEISDAFRAGCDVTTSEWFASGEDFRRVLDRANVFFAPRLHEGIGMSVLEAMSMGMCVVAPDCPTMNEYIRHGENGLLYELAMSSPVRPLVENGACVPVPGQRLDLSEAERMAARAREDACEGYRAWLEDSERFVEFVTSRSPSRWDFAPELEDDPAGWYDRRLASGMDTAGRKGSATISVIVRHDSARDGMEALETTLLSVLGQSFMDKELIVLAHDPDGNELASRAARILPPGTASLRRLLDGEAGGDFVLMLDAGERLASEDTLARICPNLTDGVDMVYGECIEHSTGTGASLTRTWPVNYLQLLASRGEADTVSRRFPRRGAVIIRRELAARHLDGDVDDPCDAFLRAVWRACASGPVFSQLHCTMLLAPPKDQALRPVLRQTPGPFAVPHNRPLRVLNEIFPEHLERKLGLSAMHVAIICDGSWKGLDDTLESLCSQHGDVELNIMLAHNMDSWRLARCLDRWTRRVRQAGTHSLRRLSLTCRRMDFASPAQALLRLLDMLNGHGSSFLAVLSPGDTVLPGGLAKIAHLVSRRPRIGWLGCWSAMPTAILRHGFADGRFWHEMPGTGVFLRLSVWRRNRGCLMGVGPAWGWNLWRSVAGKERYVHVPDLVRTAGRTPSPKARERFLADVTHLLRQVDPAPRFPPLCLDTLPFHTCDVLEEDDGRKQVVEDTRNAQRLAVFYWKKHAARRVPITGTEHRDMIFPPVSEGNILLSDDPQPCFPDGEFSGDQVPGEATPPSSASQVARKVGWFALRSLKKRLKQTGLFFPRFYLDRYPDVRKSGQCPYRHYLLQGAAQGRWPNPMFDSAWYLETYRDVAAAGYNPLIHYAFHGWKEGRQPSPLFSPLSYLAANPDVAEAGLEPLRHYLQYGIVAGRSC